MNGGVVNADHDDPHGGGGDDVGSTRNEQAADAVETQRDVTTPAGSDKSDAHHIRINIDDDIPLDELQRCTTSTYTDTTTTIQVPPPTTTRRPSQPRRYPQVRIQHSKANRPPKPALMVAPSTSSATPALCSNTAVAPCPNCGIYQEHARVAYQELMTLSRCLHRLREVEMEKEQLGRINAEQQTYLHSQSERSQQQERRMEEKEARIRQLEEEVTRLGEQYRLVLESTREFKRSADMWEARYHKSEDQLHAIKEETAQRRNKYIKSVEVAEAAVEKYEAEQRHSLQLALELESMKRRMEAEKHLSCAFLRELEAAPKLEKMATVRSPAKRRRLVAERLRQSSTSAPANETADAQHLHVPNQPFQSLEEEDEEDDGLEEEPERMASQVRRHDAENVLNCAFLTEMATMPLLEQIATSSSKEGGYHGDDDLDAESSGRMMRQGMRTRRWRQQ